MNESLSEDEFQARVVGHLQPHPVALANALRQRIRHGKPAEDRSEFFVFDSGKAEHPSPIDPDLVELDRMCDDLLEEEHVASLPASDPLGLADEALIPWFAGCWRDGSAPNLTAAERVSAAVAPRTPRTSPAAPMAPPR